MWLLSPRLRGWITSSTPVLPLPPLERVWVDGVYESNRSQVQSVCECVNTKVYVCDNANKKALFSIYVLQVLNARTILNKKHGCRCQMSLMEVDHVDEQEPSPIRGREQKPTTRNIIPSNFVDQCDFSGPHSSGWDVKIGCELLIEHMFTLNINAMCIIRIVKSL